MPNRRVFWSLLLALALARCSSEADFESNRADIEPYRPGQETFISRAIFADDRLWLLSDAGMLSSISETESKRRETDLPEPVIDMWLEAGQPAVLTCRREACTNWTIRRRNGDQWDVAAEIPVNGEQFVAIGAVGEEVTLLTSRRIVRVARDQIKTTALAEPLRPLPITSVQITAQFMFVGFNVGEWGGGLQRIELSTGNVKTMERNVSGGLCDGPLNTACDPVNGIATEPWNEACVAAAIGLVHFSPHGRIVEICHDEIERLYFKPYGSERTVPDSDEPFSTVAFFGLTRKANELWAVGIDGIYKIGQNKAVEFMPLPNFKVIDGFTVSFDLPGIVLVLTDVNARRSISGSVPLMVPR